MAYCRLKEVFHRAVNTYRLLIIDEIGYLPIGRIHPVSLSITHCQRRLKSDPLSG
jgi:DNA replication protein DnaC